MSGRTAAFILTSLERANAKKRGAEMDEMGVETGIDVDRVLKLGEKWEKTIGCRLRLEAILNGRIPKQPTRGI